MKSEQILQNDTGNSETPIWRDVVFIGWMCCSIRQNYELVADVLVENLVD